MINIISKKCNFDKNYDLFLVKIIQLYYNDNYDIYNEIKEEIITDNVCI